MSQLNTRFLPGRLGDAGLNLRDDPRADKRMLAAMEARGLLEPIPALPIDAESTIDELLAFCAENEAVYEEMNEEANACDHERHDRRKGVQGVGDVYSDQVTVDP